MGGENGGWGVGGEWRGKEREGMKLCGVPGAITTASYWDTFKREIIRPECMIDKLSME